VARPAIRVLAPPTVISIALKTSKSRVAGGDPSRLAVGPLDPKILQSPLDSHERALDREVK